MKQSQLFTKTTKDVSQDEVSKNAQLLLRAGFIHKEMAGAYAFLPLGLRVLNNIMQVIREEMNAVGGQEVLLTALQRQELWEQTDRWDEQVVDVWFKTALASGSVVGLGFTHEEPLTDLMRKYVTSYRDLPAYPYQFQLKFRNEIRAKSGIMRTREFIMKDLYSFSQDQQQHDEFYERMKIAYTKIFDRVGLGAMTYITFASGGSFSKFSHEFQTLSDAGEDIVYVHEDKKIAINKEVYTPEVLAELGVGTDELVEKKSIEVGNIFSLGTKFSSALDLSYTDESGDVHPVIMGSYGIGPGRLMGTIAEVFADEHGLVWPRSVAPFQVHLIGLDLQDPAVQKQAEDVYKKLQSAGVDVLFDDRRDVRAGEKFADSDLMGIPVRAIISKRTEHTIEVKQRQDATVQMMMIDELLAMVLAT